MRRQGQRSEQGKGSECAERAPEKRHHPGHIGTGDEGTVNIPAALARRSRDAYIADMFIETETTPNPATLKFLPGGDFVSVTAAPGAGWTALKPQVVAILLDHFVSEAPLFSGGDASGFAVPSEPEIEDDPADAEIVAQIRELIETRVRPAVAADGGDIRYQGFREGVVYLQMQGACSGCPSSTATLKHGIEGLLKHYVPEVIEVRAA